MTISLFRSMILTVLLTVLGSTPALSSDPLPFLEELEKLGATRTELDRFEQDYRDASPEQRASIENGDREWLKGYLAYKRSAWASESEHPLLAIGSPMPDFSLKGVDGTYYSPASFADAELVVVAFISNHCPASQMYESRLKALVGEFTDQGVAFVAIQPDGPLASAPSEHNFTDVEDDFAGMVERARYRHFTFPYLYDGDEQAAARAFGPKVTPHLFIFDKQRILRYEGRIDNHLRIERATTSEARDALLALLDGREPEPSHTPVFGCSLKWNDRMENAERERREWAQLPVALKTVAVDELRALRTNPPARVTIFNMWATWCGPCRVELPEIVKSYQWYRSRGVELVTVSLDGRGAEQPVLEFLRTVHSPASNLLVDTDDFYAVQAAFDQDWQSGVPYTVVVADNGAVIYRHEGELDILAMRRAILAHLDEPGVFAGNAEYWRQ